MGRTAGMSDGVYEPHDRLDRRGYVLEIEDTFQAPTLNERLWIPHYLPQWSSREASAARYEVGGGLLRLMIEADQEPWNPEFDGELRVSSLQTGAFAGPVGSSVGQHRFRPDLVVREAQEMAALYTPQHGLFELRARALDDPSVMVALWMIGYEDEPNSVCGDLRVRDLRARRRPGHGPHRDGSAPVRRFVDHGCVLGRGGADRRAPDAHVLGRVDA